GFVLEVLSLFIPGWVETDQLERIARILVEVGSQIPYTILAFFPEYQLTHVPPPNLNQMIEAYTRVKETGLKNVRLGNVGIFARTPEQYELVRSIS
ncbi:MAG: radical SAM protein, partial [Deltaproteobacteria bacterium]